MGPDPGPAGTLSSPRTASASLARYSSPARAAVARALDLADDQCGRTDFDTYIDPLLAPMTPADLELLVRTPALDVATYDALLHGSPTDSRYALTRSSAQDLTSTFRDLRRFWDIDSSDIRLFAMHGSVLLDQTRTARTLREVLDDSDAAAKAEAARIATGVRTSKALAIGNNPIFTLNAFAFTAEGDPDPRVQGVGDSIVYGDGILDAMASFGLGSVGTRSVLAHASRTTPTGWPSTTPAS